MILGVLDSVTSRIRHDEPLLRILAEREAGQILSLRHPCPDRAIASFIRTWRFWEENGVFIACYYSVYFWLRNNRRVQVNSGRTLKGCKLWGDQRDSTVGETTLVPPLYIGGMKERVLNTFRSPRKSADENAPFSLPHAIDNR